MPPPSTSHLSAFEKPSSSNIQNSNTSVNDPTAGTALPMSNECMTTFSEDEKRLLQAVWLNV